MAESIALTYASNITVEQTLDSAATPSAAAATRKVIHQAFNTAVSLTGSTSPAATKMAGFETTLSSGAATIDLTSIAGTNGATVTGNTLKVRAVKFIAPSGNGSAITLDTGDTNGIDLFGSSWSVTLSPGQEFMAYLANGAPTIGASDKTIDLAGTGSSDKIQTLVVFG